MAIADGTTTYRIDQSVVLRAVGPILVLIGLLWALAAVLGTGTPVRVVLGLVTTGFIGAAVVAVVRPPRLLALSGAGFRVSLIRGSGTPAADWSEVESVDTRDDRGGRSVVIDLSDGRFTVVPVSLLGRRSQESRREIHDRLNAAFGYRHLDAS